MTDIPEGHEELGYLTGYKDLGYLIDDEPEHIGLAQFIDATALRHYETQAHYGLLPDGGVRSSVDWNLPPYTPDKTYWPPALKSTMPTPEPVMPSEEAKKAAIDEALGPRAAAWTPWVDHLDRHMAQMTEIQQSVVDYYCLHPYKDWPGVASDITPKKENTMTTKRIYPPIIDHVKVGDIVTMRHGVECQPGFTKAVYSIVAGPLVSSAEHDRGGISLGRAEEMVNEFNWRIVQIDRPEPAAPELTLPTEPGEIVVLKLRDSDTRDAFVALGDDLWVSVVTGGRYSRESIVREWENL